jgi:DNA-binding ferritin-like protein (Dps family)
MATSDHGAIRDYLMRESGGTGNAGKKMVLNPVTGKFEVAGAYEAGGSEVAEITAEDMRSFSEERYCAA